MKKLLLILLACCPLSAQTLAGKSMTAWNANKQALLAYSESYFQSLIGIDPTVTPDTLSLGTRNWPGYYTVLRHNYGTASENACWLLSGSYYSDHRHYDPGQIDCYFMRVPLFIDPTGYNAAPPVNGNILHSTVLRDSTLTGAATTWNGDVLSMNLPLNQGTQAQCETLGFTKVSFACATITNGGDVWTRKIALTNGNTTLPLVAVWDTFNGSEARTLIWNPLTITGGAITTPDGPNTPTARTVPCNGSPGTLPSGGSSFSLGSGLPVFAMTGSTWTSLGAGGNGIDTDFYFRRATSGALYAIGNMLYPCSATREMGEFLDANGASFTANHARILVNDTGAAFSSFFAPHYKNVTPTRTPTASGDGISNVTTSPVSTTEILTSTAYSFTDGTVNALASFDTSRHTAFSLTLTDNPSEIACSTSAACVWTVSSMTAGTACVDLSAFGGTWYASTSVTNPSANKFCRYHPGADATTGQSAAYTINLSTTPGTRTSIPLQGFAASGTMEVRFGSATEFVGQTACSGACTVTVLAPSGVTPWSQCKNVTTCGGQNSYTVP